MDAAHNPTHADGPADSQTTLPGTVESIRPTFSRSRAIRVANRLKPILLKHVFQDRTGERYCRIAGSLRRHAEEVHDLDTVAVISTVPDDMQSSELSPRGRLSAEIKAKADTVLLWGPDRARFVFEGLPVDLFFTRPKTFAVAMIAATGSSGHLLRLTRRARRAGLRFHPTRHLLTTAENLPVYVPTEEDFYQRLNLPAVPPPAR